MMIDPTTDAWWRAVLHSRDLPKSARLVGHALQMLLAKRKANGAISYACLAEYSRCSERTVGRSIAALVNHGFIEVRKRGFATTDEFRILPPPSEFPPQDKAA